jgi:glutathione-independent formaldehyde dehydrogenase
MSRDAKIEQHGVSHHLSLDQAPDAYQHFDARDNGWTKVVLHPNA